MSTKKRIQSISRQLALEPRLLFDAGLPVAMDQAADEHAHAGRDTAPVAEEVVPAAESAWFTSFSADAVVKNNVAAVKNTSPDGTVTVGEDDEPSKVLKDWKVSGTGVITATIEGQADGLGTLVSGSGAWTVTGTVNQVNDWLENVQYQYTQKSEQQKQTGDSYVIKITVSASDGSGGEFYQTINIAPQNDAPMVNLPADGGPHFSVEEGGTYQFSAAELGGGGLGFTHAVLGLSDPDNATKQVIIKLESLPDAKYGQLVLKRGEQELILAVGSTFSVAELGNLEYRTIQGEQVSPNNGGEKTPLQSFKFTIDDGAGGRSSGHEVRIELTPVNQVPSIGGSATIVEGEQNVSLGAGGSLVATRPDGSTTTIILSDRGKVVGVDPDDSADQLSYTITSLPEHGVLKYNGVELTADNIASTQIKDLNKLTYSHTSDIEPKDHGSQDSFRIVVKDGGGGTGEATSSAELTVKLTILENNDDPSLLVNKEQNYQALREAGDVKDNVFTITKDMLAVSDPDSFDANLVFKITEVTDPNLGYFTVNGNRLAAGKSFTMQDVIDGKVQYHLRFSSTEQRTDSFSFTVVDSATGLIFDADGKAFQRDGGIYEGSNPNAQLKEHTFTVVVPEAEQGKGGNLPDLPPEAPAMTVKVEASLTGVLESGGTLENNGGAAQVTQNMLETTDGVTPPEKIVYRLETLPIGGQLMLGDKALGQFDSFTQADINAGKVTFQHDGSEQFAHEFQFSVSNGVTTTAGLHTFHITSVPQNDTPEASQGAGLNVLEGGQIKINDQGLQHIVLSDRDVFDSAGVHANKNELWFTVTQLPQHGQLLLNGKAISEGATVTQADLDDGKLVYQHDGSENFKDSFVIQPDDSQSVVEPTATNQKSQGEAATIHITIAPDNDAPEKQAKQELVDTQDGGNVAKNGLYEGGSAIIWGQDLTKTESGTPYGQLVYTDSDNTDPEQIQYRLTETTKYGQLVLSRGDKTVILAAGSTFTQDDLNKGYIEYRHNGGEDHVDQFKYLVSDGDHSVNDASSNDSRTPGQTIVETEASVFRIQVKPSNDKPTVSAPSKPVVVDGTNSAHNKAPGFVVGDIDIGANGDQGSDKDLITVIVRVTDAEGNPLNGAASGGYTLATTEGVKGDVSVDAGSNNAGYLQLTGSRAAVNEALASLEVGFKADQNAKYQLQVIVDDRLNKDGTDYQNGGSGVTANGGDMNREGKGMLDAVDGRPYTWETMTTQEILERKSLNLSVASVELWVSTVNEPATIVTVPGDTTVYEDVPTKLTGWEFADAESQAFDTKVEVVLSVTGGTLSAKLPQGITVTGEGTHTLTLRGDVKAINAFLDSTDTNTGVFYTSALNQNGDTNADAAGDVTLTVALKEGAFNSDDPRSGGSAIGGDTGGGSPIPEEPFPQKTVAITVAAANDAPVVSVTDKDKPVVITDPEAAKGGFGFSVQDLDVSFDAEGESDDLQVTVRLLDKDGNPLPKTTPPAAEGAVKEPSYEGVTLGVEGGSSVATGGVDGVLILRGTVAEVKAALEKLQVTLSNAGKGSGLGNADNPFTIQVIADDRLRDADGTLTGKANGGERNNSGEGQATTVVLVSAVEVDPYTATVADLNALKLNVATAERTIWPSSDNAKPTVSTPDGITVQEDAPTFIGGGFVLKDIESDQFGLEVEVTLSVGEHGILNVGGDQGTDLETDKGVVTVVRGNGTGTLVLRGTSEAITALLSDSTIKDGEVQSKGLSFTSLPDSNADHNGKDAAGDITLTITLDEFNAATAFEQEPQTATEKFYITVNPVNDAPVINGTENSNIHYLYPDRNADGATNGWHWTTGADDHDTGVDKTAHAPIHLISGATVSDVDLNETLNKTGANSFGGGSITVTLGQTVDGDVLSVDADMAGVKNVISGSDGQKLVIELSDDATAAQVAAILNAITFANAKDPSDGGQHLNRDFSIVLNDGNNGNKSSDGGSDDALDSKPLTGTLQFARYEAPIAQGDAAQASQGSATATGNVLRNDTDKETVGGKDTSENLKVTLVQAGEALKAGTGWGQTVGESAATVQGAYGTLTIHQDGSYTYVLDASSEAYKLLGDEVVQEKFTYRATDAQGLSSDATLVISVTGVDDGVTVNVDGAEHKVYESHLGDGSAETKDSSQLQVASSFEVVAREGVDSITISYTDKDGNTQSLEFSKSELEALDTQAVEPVLTQYGELRITGYAWNATTDTATVTYTYVLQNAPHVGCEHTQDVFGITAQDTVGDSQGTGSITITIVDDAPVAEDDEAAVVNGSGTNGGNDTATGNVLDGSATGDVKDIQGADGAKVTAVAGTEMGADGTLTLQGKHGSLVIHSDGSYTYTRNNGAPLDATDEFEYTIADADGDESTATLTITIADKAPVLGDKDGNPPNQEVDPADPKGGKRPVINGGSVNESGLPEGSNPGEGKTTSGTITLQPGDGTQTVTVTTPGGGTVTLKPYEEAKLVTPQGEVTLMYKPGNGTEQPVIEYTYELKTPVNDDGGKQPSQDEFTLTVTDQDGDTDEATVVVKIVDDVPMAKDDANTTLVNQPVQGQLGDNDVGGADGIQRWEVQTPPTHGTVSVDPATGSYIYTPNPGFIGTETFTYTVTDADGNTSTATVTIAVKNTPPVAVDDVHVTTPGGTASGNVLTGGSGGDRPDSDADDHTLTVTQISVEGQRYDIPEGGYVLVHLPGKGLLKVESGGGYEFVPAPFFGGKVPTIGYTISDGFDSSTATLSITATAAPLANDAPSRPIWETPHTSHTSPSFVPGDGLTQGDVFVSPSVYWDYWSDNRDLRLPELMHPITYVNHEVRVSQEMNRLYAAQAQWGGFLMSQEQLNSSVTQLAMESSVFVQFEVAQAQAEGRFWNFLARNAIPEGAEVFAEAWGTPQVQESEEAVAASTEAPPVPVTLSPEQEQEQEQEQAKSEPTPDVLLAHWMQESTSSAGAAQQAQELGASESFREQLLTNASALPGQALTQ